MTKEYGLHCFYRGELIKDKKSVCRDDIGQPICKECLVEVCSNDWEDEDLVAKDVIKNFNGNYSKFMKHINKNYTICNECNSWQPNDYFKLDKMECIACIERKEDEKKEKGRK